MERAAFLSSLQKVLFISGTKLKCSEYKEQEDPLV